MIGTIGRLTEQKDHDTLLRACHRLSHQGADCHLVIVGNGPEETRLKALTKDLGLDGQVRFIGRLPDVTAILSLFDIFVLSSIREGFANVILEAMAMGKPVVATDVGGNAEAVVHEETGLIVPPSSAEALSLALLRLIKDKKTARQMGQKCRRRVASLYPMGRMVQETGEIYTIYRRR